MKPHRAAEYHNIRRRRHGEVLCEVTGDRVYSVTVATIRWL